LNFWFKLTWFIIYFAEIQKVENELTLFLIYFKSKENKKWTYVFFIYLYFLMQFYIRINQIGKNI